jgi:hypothetical protein
MIIDVRGLEKRDSQKDSVEEENARRSIFERVHIA